MTTIRIQLPNKVDLDAINYAADVNRDRIANCSWLLSQLVQRPELLEAVRKVDENFAEEISWAVRHANDAYRRLVAAFVEGNKVETLDSTP